VEKPPPEVVSLLSDSEAESAPSSSSRATGVAAEQWKPRAGTFVQTAYGVGLVLRVRPYVGVVDASCRVDLTEKSEDNDVVASSSSSSSSSSSNSGDVKVEGGESIGTRPKRQKSDEQVTKELHRQINGSRAAAAAANISEYSTSRVESDESTRTSTSTTICSSASKGGDSARKRRRRSATKGGELDMAFIGDIVAVHLEWGTAYLHLTAVREITDFSLKIVDTELRHSDTLRLHQRMFLNDNLMNFALAHLIPQAAAQGVALMTTYFLPSLRIVIAGNKAGKDRKERFRRLLRKSNVTPETRHMLIPFNENEHWSLIYVRNVHEIRRLCTSKELMNAAVAEVTSGGHNNHASVRQLVDADSPALLLIDSAEAHRAQTAFLPLREFLSHCVRAPQKISAPLVPGFRLPLVSQQANNFDCGLYALEFVRRLIVKPPTVFGTHVIRRGMPTTGEERRLNSGEKFEPFVSTDYWVGVDGLVSSGRVRLLRAIDHARRTGQAPGQNIKPAPPLPALLEVS